MTQLDLFQAQRPLLFAIAYRMLGSASEAEDLVQETYLRYLAASPAEIRSPRAYLSTIITRLCLDALSAARATREQYIGPWLPEPLLTEGGDLPFESAAQHESISMAFLILLERLTPHERAVFLLREVFEYPHQEIALMTGLSAAACRQHFHRAQQRLAEGRARFPPAPAQQQQLVQQFIATVQRGDVQGFAALLAADVASWSDGGGKVSAARQVVYGPTPVARLIVGASSKLPPDRRIELAEVNGQLAILLWAGATLRSLSSLQISDGAIAAIYMVLNPAKLAYLQRQRTPV
jgi:RNA polymerase sigma-70 factor, ECF subfamily